MILEAEDFRAETRALDELLGRLAAEDWRLPTQFKGWTANDILEHLDFWNHAVGLALSEPDGLMAELGGVQAALGAGRSLRETESARLAELFGALEGDTLRDRWRRTAEDLANAFAAADPSTRVAWVGPSMSARSAIVARQMETWAHGQALFDLVGVERKDADRLRNVAELGVRTFGWTFANRREPVPETIPRVALSSPSGARWVWNDDCASDSITGSATAFCQVVTQVRNVADTDLEVVGELAERWMAKAQCFAGPPVDPPGPGSRHRRVS